MGSSVRYGRVQIRCSREKPFPHHTRGLSAPVSVAEASQPWMCHNGCALWQLWHSTGATGFRFAHGENLQVHTPRRLHCPRLGKRAAKVTQPGRNDVLKRLWGCSWRSAARAARLARKVFRDRVGCTRALTQLLHAQAAVPLEPEKKTAPGRRDDANRKRREVQPWNVTRWHVNAPSCIAYRVSLAHARGVQLQREQHGRVIRGDMAGTEKQCRNRQLSTAAES